MQRLLLASAVLALSAASAPAQDPPTPAPMDAARAAALDAWQRSPQRLERAAPEDFPAHLSGPGVPYGLNELDGELVGVGPGFTARFSGGDFEVCERMGAGKLAFELQEIVRGDALLWSRELGAGPLVQEGFEATSALTPTLEAHFRVGADGVEQSFLVRSLPPGRGDLVVRGTLETELLPEVSSAGCEGIELRPASGGRSGLRYGGVLGIDTAGRTRHGSLSIEGGVLELRLPAHFVDTAALPLVLDPLVSPMDTQMATSPFYEPNSPATAFDETAQRYLTVWAERDIYGRGDVYGQFLTSAGVPVGGLLSLVQDVSSFPMPRLANVNASNRFLLVYKDGSLRARAVNAIGGGVSTATEVAPYPGYYGYIEHSVGGEVLPPYDKALVAWVRSDSWVRVRLVRVPSSGPPVLDGAYKTLASGLTKHSIRVSPSGGAAGRWIVAFHNLPYYGTDQIVGHLVNYALTTSTARTLSSDPDAAYPAVAGDGNTFVAAVSVQGQGVFARPLFVTSTGQLGMTVPMKRVDDGLTGASVHSGLTVDYVGGQPIVAYKANASVSGATHHRIVGRQLLGSTGLPIGTSFVLSDLTAPESHDLLPKLFAAQSASAWSTPTHALLVTASLLGGVGANVYTSRVQL